MVTDTTDAKYFAEIAWKVGEARVKPHALYQTFPAD